MLTSAPATASRVILRASALTCALAVCGCGAPSTSLDAEGSGSEGDSETGDVPDCEAAQSETSCEQTAGSDSRCVWATVQHLESADACGGQLETGGRCIEAVYQGEGCGVSSTCWVDFGWVPQSFYKLDPDGTAWIMIADVCEYWPSDPSWQQCRFMMDEQTMTSTVDHPICKCLCE